MVVDSSLTNIFVVNGVSQIRYRVYAQNYSRSSLLQALKSPHELRDLMWTFRNLKDRRIPCTWRVASKSTETRSQTTDQVRVELWVFWFDERRTGEIDGHQGLSTLEEVRMGSFTWESVTKGRTAKSSPNLNSKRPRALVAVTEEYKVFMQALKNLLHASLIRAGAIPLGDFYINSHYDSQSDSLVGCAYNAYLTGSDLVFQPYTRRLRLRAYAPSIDQGNRVILSPSGEHAVVVSARIEMDTTAREIARQWSLLFDMPQLENSSLVCIRTKRITVFYPSDLIFVAQPLRHGSRLMAGMESTLRENRGHVHDVGQLWCMGVDEQAADGLRRSAIDALIAADGKSASSISAKALLQRMREQPIMSSPIMAAKTIGTPPHALSPLSVSSPKDSRPSDSESSTISTSFGSGALGKASSLLDYALKNFSAINNDEAKAYMPSDIMDNLDTKQPIDADATTNTQDLPKADTDDHPEVEQLLYGGMDDSFPVLEMSRQWDNAMDVDDFDNFNLDVTEEDFDFFESATAREPQPASAVAPSAPEATEGAQTAPVVSASSDSAQIMPPTVDFNAIIPEPSVIPEVQMLDAKLESSDLSTAMDLDTPTAPASTEFPAPMVKNESEEHGHTSPNISEMTAVASSDAGATAFHDSPAQLYRTTKEEQELVPQGFTPVRFSTGVDDAKYLGGGKFMYSEDGKATQPEVYRPDYKPPLTKRLEEAAAKRKAQDEEIADDEDDSSSSGSSSSSDDDSDTSSAEDSSDLSSISSDEHKNDPAGALGEAQMIFVRRLLRDIRNQPKRHRVNHLMLDYDSPFSSVQSIQPQRMVLEDLISLDYLCRQTVWGAYPFMGDPYENAFASSPDCGQGESIQVVVDRQRTLIQCLRGDITHVPCLASDSARTMHGFKNALLDVFEEQDVPDTPLLAEHSLIDVKGPLSIQQYYELAETSQPHSKYYGKYQVKKRKSVDPNLSNLPYPDIVVGQKDEWLEGSPEMLNYWEKLHLEPYSCKNNVQYVVLYPGSDEYVGSVVRRFFHNLSAVYEACSLGTHHAGRLNPQYYEGACVPVITTEKNVWLQSYMSACEAVAASLAGETLDPSSRVVIYLVNPSSSRLSATFDLSRCFHHLITTYRTLVTKAGGRPDNSDHIVMQLVPLEHVFKSSTYTMQGFKDIAFSVYRQCRVPSQKQHHLQMYTPPWVLAEPLPEKVQLNIKNPLITRPQIVQDTSATIHVAYTFSLDRRWMVVVWTDNRGTMMDFSVLEIQTDTTIGSPLTGVFKETWTRTKRMAERTGLQWNTVLAKMGLIFEGELQVWVDIVEGEDKVAIVSLDIESPFHCSLSAPVTEISSSNMNNSNPNIADITPPAAAAATAAQRAGPYDAPVAQLIVLNHRVGYSRRRVEAYQGNLAMDSVHSELEGWILSLATGYLVQEPCTATDTLHQASTMELHLVYNQNTQTPYTTVHRILQQYHGLCFVNQLPSTLVRKARIPSHLATVERLCRLLLVIGS